MAPSSEKTAHQTSNHASNDIKMEANLKSSRQNSDHSENESGSVDSGHFSLSPNHPCTGKPLVTPKSKECSQVSTTKTDVDITPVTVRKKLNFSIDSLLAKGSDDSGCENSDRETHSADDNENNSNNGDSNENDNNGTPRVVVSSSFAVNGLLNEGRGLLYDVNTSKKTIGCYLNEEVKRGERQSVNEDLEVDVECCMEDDQGHILTADTVSKLFEVKEGVRSGDNGCSRDLKDDISTTQRSSVDSRMSKIGPHPYSTVANKVSQTCDQSINETACSSPNNRIDPRERNSSANREAIHVGDAGNNNQSSVDSSTTRREEIGLESPSRTPSAQGKPKRKLKRTQYSKEDLDRLTTHFLRNPWLSPEKQERVARDMGYTETQIKTWFQNKRASIFGSRQPKKRPLQELFHNHPISSQNLLYSQTQQQQQHEIHPLLLAQLQKMQQNEHSRAKYTKREDTRENQSPSLHLPTNNTLAPYGNLGNVPTGYAPFSTQTQERNVPGPNHQLHENGNKQEERTSNAVVKFERNTLTSPANTPLHQNISPLYTAQVPQYFSPQYANPSVGTLPPPHPSLPMVPSPGYYSYPLPMPHQYAGFVQPSYWLPHNVYSPFQISPTSAFTAMPAHPAALVKIDHNPYHHTDSNPRETAPGFHDQSQSQKRQTPATTAQTSHNPDAHEDRTRQNLPCNQNNEAVNIASPPPRQANTNDNNQDREDDEQRRIQSDFMRDLSDRLHQKSANKNNEVLDGSPSSDESDQSTDEAIAAYLPDRVTSTSSPSYDAVDK